MGYDKGYEVGSRRAPVKRESSSSRIQDSEPANSPAGNEQQTWVAAICCVVAVLLIFGLILLTGWLDTLTGSNNTVDDDMGRTAAVVVTHGAV